MREFLIAGFLVVAFGSGAQSGSLPAKTAPDIYPQCDRSNPMFALLASVKWTPVLGPVD
jgi:hypothetical protein